MTSTTLAPEVTDLTSLDDAVPCEYCEGAATIAVVLRCCGHSVLLCGPCHEHQEPRIIASISAPLHYCALCPSVCAKSGCGIPTHYKVGPI